MVECRFPSDKAYPSELDNELPLKVNTDLLNFCGFCAFHELFYGRASKILVRGFFLVVTLMPTRVGNFCNKFMSKISPRNLV